MQHLTIIALLAATCAVASGVGLAADGYRSLLDFCLRTQADTPENCQCGQETADRIMTDVEQSMALTMMAQGQPPSFASAAEHDAFMAKLSRVTSGCAPGAAPE